MKYLIPCLLLLLNNLLFCQSPEDQARKLVEEGKFLEAAKAYENIIDTLRKSPDKKLSELAENLNSAGYSYKNNSDYEKALSLFNEALSIDRSLNQDENICSDLNNIGDVYITTAKYDSAVCYLEEALVIARKVNHDDLTFTVLYNIADAYRFSDQYSKALEPYEEALGIAKKIGQIDFIPLIINNIGTVYLNLGEYSKAIEKYQETLQTDQKNNKKSDEATDLNNIGRIYQIWGKYDKAIKNYKDALAINEQMKDTDKVGIRLNNIGGVYQLWGKYDKAMEYYKKALSIAEQLSQRDKIAIRLSNIGTIYGFLNKPDSAMALYKKALEINEPFKTPSEISLQLSNLGSSYYQKGDFQKALELYKNALDISVKLSRQSDISVQLNNIGDVYYSTGKYEKALEYYQQAFEIAKKLDEADKIAKYNKSIGAVLYSQKKYDEATKNFRESIEILEQIRKTAHGDVRRDYLASQIDSYQYLISCLIKNKKDKEALYAFEQSAARYLSEQLGEKIQKDSLPLINLNDYQAKMHKNSAVLCLSVLDHQKSIAEILMDKDSLTAVEKFDEASLNDLYKKLSRRIKNTLKINDSENISQLYLIVTYYRYLLSKSVPGISERENQKEIGKILFNLLFKDFEKFLSEKEEIVVIPGGILSMIPFETLVMPDNRYLIEKYNIRYAQSLNVLNLISLRNYKQDRNSVLAFGGAIYDSSSYENTIVESDEQLKSFKNTALLLTENKLDMKDSYRDLGYGKITNLPGTLTEVKAIKDVFHDGRIITGKDVSEQTVKRMSENGELKDYKVIHFATHGLSVPEVPELSALVLSQIETEKKEDGFLRMQEIAGLDMNADFVNLSACETGLGKIYSGEGLVGLTQSFLVAGANGVSVSLWKVEDRSTQKFMVDMYRLAVEKRLPYDKAITQMKRNFIKSNYNLPFYWAPFVYYGR